MTTSTPLKAMRQKCIDCMAGQLKEVLLCPSDDCALWHYRMGHNPNRKNIENKGKFKKKE